MTAAKTDQLHLKCFCVSKPCVLLHACMRAVFNYATGVCEPNPTCVQLRAFYMQCCMHACMHAVFNYETGVYEPDPNGDKLARLMYIHARDTWDKAVSGHTHTHMDARRWYASRKRPLACAFCASYGPVRLYARFSALRLTVAS